MILKKATQATFKIAPPWVKSIAVNRNGECWGFEVVVADLETNDRRFWCALMDKEAVFLGSGFDATAIEINGVRDNGKVCSWDAEGGALEGDLSDLLLASVHSSVRTV